MAPGVGEDVGPGAGRENVKVVWLMNRGAEVETGVGASVGSGVGSGVGG